MERPLVGIVSSYNEIVPGHMNLDKIVDAVKQGVAMAGGTPIVFPAIADLRRELPGPCGYEILSGYQRLDCRFYRMYGNGSSV